MYNFLLLVTFIILTTNMVLKNKKQLKGLSKKQITGLSLAYIIIFFIAFVCVYYGGNWIVGYFSNSNVILRIIMDIMVCFIPLYICVIIFNILLQKITKGVLPLK